ncbi:Glutamate-gated chloride channel [Halotydeus destructor]|nr:Glutamate-gated chloride channel [Halotydeus destructor]
MLNDSGKEGQDGPCIVRTNLYVRSISRIDDVTMEYATQITFREQWRDDRLVYDDRNGRIKFLTLTDPDKIWKPDLFFSNEKEGHFHDIIMPNVLLRIYPDGAILYSIRISLVLACPMDLKYYPLDKQTCSIQMASYGYTTEDVVLLWKEENPVQITKTLHLPRFTLTNKRTEYCTSRTNTGEYSCIRVDLIFRREFSYYLIQIYIPCIMLVIVSWVSFWLDPNAIPARVSLGVTTLLTMATQISGINASLPPVSYTKAIDVWTGVCLTFVFGALLEFALVNYASRSDAHKAALKKKTEQQQAQVNEVLTVNNQVNQGWDIESSFDFGNIERGPTSYVMKPLNRQSRGLLPGYNPLLPPPGSRSHNPMIRPAPGSGPPSALPGGQGGNGLPTPAIRDCEIYATTPTKNFCQKWLSSFPTRSKRIDVISRIFFPLMFGMFNVVYWFTYSFRDDLND